jgi:hypothetical protein
MPSPLPRWVLRVFRSAFPEDFGLPRFSVGSAPTLPVSRPAQRSLTLRPACSLTPRGGFLLKCFSPIRYLFEPLQVLPAGATVAGRDSYPLETPRLSRRTEKSGLVVCSQDPMLYFFMPGKLKKPPMIASPGSQELEKRIAAIRKKRGITQVQLAEIIGIGQTLISAT